LYQDSGNVIIHACPARRLTGSLSGCRCFAQAGDLQNALYCRFHHGHHRRRWSGHFCFHVCGVSDGSRPRVSLSMSNRRSSNGCLTSMVILGFFIQAFSWMMFITEENRANHTLLYVAISVTFTLCLLVIWYWSGQAAQSPKHRKAVHIILGVAGFLLLALLILHMMLTVCARGPAGKRETPIIGTQQNLLHSC